MDALIKDPVCGMEVKPHQNEVVYLGVEYAFCSEQCQKQFLKDPRLYIDSTVREENEQQGMTLLKSRRMRLGAALPPEHAEALALEMQQLRGVNHVLAKADRLEISYDSHLATTEQIESKLVDIGNRIGGGWAERLRRAFTHYEEECQSGDQDESD